MIHTDDDVITGHALAVDVLTPDGVETGVFAWLPCDLLNATPPLNALTLRTDPPLSACGRHPADWGTHGAPLAD
jgi:hypothetical protein